ncbi:hypothetical protein [Halopiger thermotolerans]
MRDDGHVTGLCPTVNGYVLAARDGDDEPTCLICGEAVEPVFPGANGGNNTNGLEGDETNRKPAIQPEHDAELRKPYAVYGNGAVEQAIDSITDERILRLHFDGDETPFYADHRRTDDGLRYAREGYPRSDASPAEIGYGMAKAVFYEFVPLEESLFANDGGKA